MATESNRRPRSDSVHAATDAFQRASKMPAWPDTVSRLSRPEDADRAAAIFLGIVAARDPADWRPNDLALAGQLANAMAQADRVNAEIEATGWTIPSPKNPLHMIRNPLLDALTLISSRQLSLTRALALNGSPADKRTITKNARLIDDARAIAGRDDNFMGLLAT